MDLKMKEQFIENWNKHFPNCDLPIVCFYSNELNGVNFPKAPKPRPEGFTCIFSQLAAVRVGKARAFNKENLGCFGSFLPLGFDTVVSEDVKNYVCNIELVKKSYEHC